MGVLRVLRPTLYKEEYCQMLVEHMAKGLSFESFAAVINVNRATLYLWCEKHEEFIDSKNIGREKQLLNDELVYNKAMRGEIKNASASLLIFKMKNCHSWKEDNQQLDDTDLEIES